MGDVATAKEALLLAAETRPDVAVVDLDLGEGPTGLDVAHRLREMFPRIGLVVLISGIQPRACFIRLVSPPSTVRSTSDTRPRCTSERTHTSTQRMRTPLPRACQCFMS